MPWLSLEAKGPTVIRVRLQATDGVKTRGRYKGDPRFVGPIHEAFVSLDEAKAQRQAWLDAGGKCAVCMDEKRLVTGCGPDGTKYRPCPECGEGEDQ